MDTSKLPKVDLGGSRLPVFMGTSRRQDSRALFEVESVASAQMNTDPVVQGELLTRQSTPYGSTHEFLRGRLFEQFADDEQYQGVSPGAVQQAVGAYRSHTRENIVPDAARGKAVDYFV